MTRADHARVAPNLIRNQAIGNRKADPLPRLLTQLVDRAGTPAVIERAASRPWASALFEGRRHVVTLRIAGPNAAARRDRFVMDIGSAEWILPGHFVADISVDEDRPDGPAHVIELSALTIEDW